MFFVSEQIVGMLLCVCRGTKPPPPFPPVCPDQHHDIAAIRAADPEAQPAHPPQLGAAQPGGEELPGEQTAGGAGAPGERAAP